MKLAALTSKDLLASTLASPLLSRKLSLAVACGAVLLFKSVQDRISYRDFIGAVRIQ